MCIGLHVWYTDSIGLHYKQQKYASNEKTQGVGLYVWKISGSVGKILLGIEIPREFPQIFPCVGIEIQSPEQLWIYIDIDLFPNDNDDDDEDNVFLFRLQLQPVRRHRPLCLDPLLPASASQRRPSPLPAASTVSVVAPRLPFLQPQRPRWPLAHQEDTLPGPTVSVPLVPVRRWRRRTVVEPPALKTPTENGAHTHDVSKKLDSKFVAVNWFFWNFVSSV